MVYASTESHLSTSQNELHPGEVIDPRYGSGRADLDRARVLERGLRKLCRGDLPGREHAEQYLRHKYRMNLRAGTIRGTISVIGPFLFRCNPFYNP